MTRDITPIKWIIGAIAFLIIIAGVCYLWYQHDTAPYRQEAAEVDKLLRQWEATQKAGTEDKQTAADVSVAGRMPTTEKTRTEVTNAVLRTDINTDVVPEDASAPTQEMDNTETVRVSPHGFGPYPEIPEGAPIGEFHESDDVEMELLLRVAVKAWNEGERFLGASNDNGKVYLHYPNTVYVRYRTIINWDGTFRKRFTSALSGNIHLTQQQMRNGQVPPGIRVLELDKEGINPYEYLDLP